MRSKVALDRLRNELSRWRTSEISNRRSLRRQIEQGLVEVGTATYGYPRVFHWGEEAHVHIGSYCSIAPGVTIYAGGEHRIEWVSTFPFMEFPSEFPECRGVIGHPRTKGDVRIGHDVWIGHGATILSGVSIGTGAVVGAGSVVSNNVEPYAVVAGVPARFHKFRFTPDVRDGLLRSRWWDLSPNEIRQIAPRLLTEPTADLLRLLEVLRVRSEAEANSLE